jgi:hypothetical protein
MDYRSRPTADLDQRGPCAEPGQYPDWKAPIGQSERTDARLASGHAGHPHERSAEADTFPLPDLAEGPCHPGIVTDKVAGAKVEKVNRSGFVGGSNS